MSAYQEFSDIRFKDKECLLEALKALGYHDVEVGESLHLYGWQGDCRPETAEIVIRRRYIEAAANDVGFARRDGAYVPIISEYDSKSRWGPKTIARLKVEYARAAVRRVVRQKKATVLSDRRQAGVQTIRIRLRVA